ncbi:MAG: amino acid adenylation domain-containing protein [Bacteroidota bacterium]|nr:amino acid adenylation domain-containing protein [Bacteroidota bacterium]
MVEYLSLVDVFLNQRKSKKGVIFIDGDTLSETLSYQQLVEKSEFILGKLQEKGIKPKDELVFQLESNKEFIITFWACLLGGIIPVPIAPAINPESRFKLQNVWKVLKNPTLVCNIDTLKRFREKTASDNMVAEEMAGRSILVEELLKSETKGEVYNPKPADIAFIQFSSGSTGEPKGVVLTHENLISNIKAIIACSDLRESDSTIGWMPLTHDMGLIGFHFTPLFRGIDQILMPTNLFVRQPALWLKKVHEHKATFLASPNFGYKHFLSYYKEDQIKDWDLSHVRRILNGAEPISVALCDKFLSVLASTGLQKKAMFPVYGMAEASLAVTFPPIDKEYKTVYLDRKRLNFGEKVEEISEREKSVGFMVVGTAVNDCKVRICDNHNQHLENRTVGLIQIKGKNVTGGYYNNTLATESLITVDGWLNTGDLGFLNNNELVITGRAKDVIFFNGQNFYAHDIERVAEELKEFEQGKVVAFGTTNEELQKEEVILFVQHRGMPEQFIDLAVKLKTYISQKIALEITHILPVNNIPKTTSGKVQRFRLGDQYKIGAFDDVIQLLERLEYEQFSLKEHLAPVNEVERKLVKIWEEVLGIEGLGTNDNFFELGGHSLKAALLISVIHQEFDVELNVREVFKAPTIQKIAKYIQSGKNSVFSAIETVSERNYYPLSSAQRRLFILDQLEKDNTAYNITSAISIKGDLNYIKLEEAFKKIIERHEVFRTTFSVKNDGPVQFVHASLSFALEFFEKDEIGVILKKFVRPFNLSQGPLFRAGVVKRELDHLLLFDVHHIIADGTSMGIIIEEFSALYQGLDLAEVQLNYKDFAAWQQKHFISGDFQEQEKYWLDKYSGELPVLNFPTDFVRPAIQDHKGAVITAHINSDITTKLKILASNTGTTLYMVILTAYNVLLARYSNQEDIIVGSPVAARSHAQVQKMIGVFINMLAMRNLPLADKTFAQFLVEVGNNTVEAFMHQDFSIDDLVSKLNLNRDLSRNPLFDTVLIFQNMEVGDLNIKDLQTSRLNIDTGTAKFDLTLEITEKDSELEVKAEYATSLFKKETIDRLVEHFKNILTGISENASVKLKDIHLLSESEKNKLLFDFNTSPKSNIGDSETIISVFENRVMQSPDQLIRCGGSEITYQQLNAQANQLAAFLRKKGAAPEKVVGLLVERSIDMMVAIWGILKSGAAYIPVDPAYPQDRIEYMLSDSEAEILVTSSALKHKVKFKGEVVDIADPEIKVESTGNVKRVNHPENLLYIIYTSGSTGKPKGVMIEHRNLLSFLPNLTDVYGFSQDDSILALTTVTFDISVLELICSVLTGMKVEIATDEVASNPQYIINLINSGSVNVLQLTPSRLQVLLETGGSDFLNKINFLLVGGEALPENLNKVISSYPKLNAYNVYGPTEDTIWSTSYRIGEGAVKIGKPHCNEEVYILSATGNLQPVGVPGELCIYSKGLSRGYLKSPELTAEKFVNNPFRSGEKMYRTGDLARWLSDGNLEYLGRIDHQVKIRGYRIELGEIESQLYENAAVKKAVVIDRNDETGFKYLCAYVVLSNDIDVSVLRQELVSSLPEYMVPSHIVKMEHIPLTQNGKVNRKELPAPSAILSKSKDFEKAEGKLEEQMLEIWKEVLSLQQISVIDNFFEIGGHSLRGTILVSQIQRKLKVDVPLRAIFNYPTIRTLSTFIEGQGVSDIKRIEAAEPARYYPASPAQKRLFVLSQFESSSTSYNMPGTFVIKGNLDVEKLKHVFCTLLERHEILRTTFEMVDGETMQLINEKVKLPFQFLNCTEKEVPSVIAQLIKPFDLSHAPLIRVAVVELSDDHYLLLCDMHHIISDGYSTEILVKEFLQLYEGKSLADQRIQYKDYAVWTQQFLQSDALKMQEVFWLNQFFEEVPVLDLPTDFKRPAVQSFEGSTFSTELNGETLTKLKEITRETGATLFMVFLAAYNILLSKYSRQKDVVVGTPVAGRKHPDLQDMIGMFVNTLALRSYPENNKTFREYLFELKDLTLNAYENQDYPFEALVDKLNLRRDMSRNPLFDTMFAYQDNSMGELQSGDVKFNRYSLDTGISKFDISLDVVEHSDRMMLIFEYALSLFKKETIEKFSGHFKNIILSIIADPDILIANVKLLDQKEEHYLLSDLNTTSIDYQEDITLVDMLKKQAILNPEKTALKHRDTEISYKQLDEKSDQIASFLIKKDVKPEKVVAVLTEPSLEMMYALIGILKSGAAYLPLDLSYPAERISFMLKDSGADIILTQKQLLEKVVFSEESICLDDPALYSEHAVINNAISPSDLAFIIYTSGSTGTPKGVMVEHRNLYDYVNTFISKVGLRAEDVMLQHSSISFDTSIEELFPILCKGGTLLIPDDRKDANELLELISNGNITAICTSPLMLNHINEEAKIIGRLRFISVGGDVLKPAYISNLVNKITIYNSYGPTESTVCITYYEVKGGETEIPIGKPLANREVYILDENQRLLPFGIPGELCVGGAGVVRGYLNAKELTQEKFISNPYKSGERIYRTGDLVKWLPDGNLAFLGRIDQQVKIRGFRVELGEIERQILQADNSIKEVAVIDREDATSAKYLCTYLVGMYNEKSLREQLLKTLPDYMVPAYFVQLDKLPVTPNGKLDKKSLPEPADLYAGDKEYKAPSNKEEEALTEVWKEVLGAKQLSVDSNFFSLGGDSIKAIQVASKLKKFGYKLDVKDLFQQLTIENIAPLLKQDQLKAEQGPVEGEVSLTPIQHSFFQEQLAEPQYYTQGAVLFLKNRFNHQLLENTLAKLTEQHDVLRMRFEKEGEKVKQINTGLQGKHFTLDIAEIDSLDTKQQIKQSAEEVQRNLDLEKGPLLKAILFKAPEGDHLLLVIHHLVIDGVSWRILMEDFMMFYQSAMQNQSVALLPKTTSYKEWADQLLNYANSDDLLKEIDFWKKLETNGVFKLPKDNTSAENLYKHSKTLSFKLSKEETADLLKNTNHAYNTEVNDVLLTALGLAVKEWTGTEKVLINLEGHGREELFNNSDITRTVGWFTSVYPVLLEASSGDLSHCIKTTKEMLRKIPNKGIGYGILKHITSADLKQGLLLNQKPEISFNYLGQFDDQQKSDFEITPLTLADTVSPENKRSCSLDINGMVMGGELTMEFSYSSEEYREQTISSLVNAYKIHLQNIINHCLNKEETEITPSDLSYSDIDLDELENIFG